MTGFKMQIHKYKDPENTVKLRIQAMHIEGFKITVMAKRSANNTESDYKRADHVTCMRCNPCNQHIAFGYDSGKIAINDKTTNEQVYIFHDLHTSLINDIVYSEDGRILVTCSDDATICVIDSERNRLKCILKTHTAAVNSVAIDKFYNIASCDAVGVINIYGVTGRVKCTIKPDKDNNEVPFCVTFNTNGTLCAVGYNTSAVVIFDVRAQRIIHDFKSSHVNGRIREITTLSFSSDGNRLLCGTSFGNIVYTLNCIPPRKDIIYDPSLKVQHVNFNDFFGNPDTVISYESRVPNSTTESETNSICVYKLMCTHDGSLSVPYYILDKVQEKFEAVEKEALYIHNTVNI